MPGVSSDPIGAGAYPGEAGDQGGGVGGVNRDVGGLVGDGGGLIGGGHPVGATGVRMVLDAARQVTGRAEATQVAGATRFGTLNIGGSTATTVSFVVSAI